VVVLLGDSVVDSGSVVGSCGVAVLLEGCVVGFCTASVDASFLSVDNVVVVVSFTGTGVVGRGPTGKVGAAGDAVNVPLDLDVEDDEIGSEETEGKEGGMDGEGEV